jgi:hypothetical protein
LASPFLPLSNGRAGFDGAGRASQSAPRRFPPPWTIKEHTESFIIRDGKLA